MLLRERLIPHTPAVPHLRECPSSERPLSERNRREADFHDAQAAQRASWYAERPEALLVDDAQYLRHESWISPAVDSLGPLRGRSVLDLGCGHGMASVVFARRGAAVTGIDLSAGYVAEARLRASVNRVSAQFRLADAERLPFADASFDCIWGNAILHHLDLSRMAGEIRRVLKPGGRAAFCEPWGENRLLRVLRRLPATGKDHTEDEAPLTRETLAPLTAEFPDMQFDGWQWLSAVCRGPLRGLGRRLVEPVERGLIARVPRLRFSCRYVVIQIVG